MAVCRGGACPLAPGSARLSEHLSQERVAYQAAARAGAESAAALSQALFEIPENSRRIDAGLERMLEILRAAEQVSAQFATTGQAQDAVNARVIRAADQMAAGSAASAESLSKAGMELMTINRRIGEVQVGLTDALTTLVSILRTLDEAVRYAEIVRPLGRSRFHWLPWRGRG